MTHLIIKSINPDALSVDYKNVNIDCSPWLKEGSVVRPTKGLTLIRAEPDETEDVIKGTGIPTGQLYVISSFNTKKKHITYFHNNIPILYIKNTGNLKRTRIFDFDIEGEFGSDTFEIQFYFLHGNKMYRFLMDFYLEGERNDIHKIIIEKRRKIRETFEESFTIMTNT